MSGLKGNGSVPSLPPPQPKSPPEYPDLYGKRRELAKAQMLEREIGFLEEELKSIEGLQLASRSCKEVADFVMGNVDPLIPINKKIRRSRRFWKWLCGVSCFSVSWSCCCNCSSELEIPQCCDCTTVCNCCSNSCVKCRMPKCHCFSWCRSSKCCKKSKCSLDCCCCCIPKCPSCTPSCSCISFTCYPKCYPKCPKLNLLSCCHKTFCYPCYFCY